MTMEYRRLGRTGLKVSALSIGAWLTYGSSRMEQDQTTACLRTAIENGINFIDCADAYAYGKAEEAVGQAIKGYERSTLVLSTKAYWQINKDDPNDRGLSRKHIFESVHKSLKRFGVDYIDIFFCHRYDDHTETEETVRALSDLVTQGKILYWGTSMWSAANIEEAIGIARATNAYAPVTEQSLYNMLDRDQVEGEVQEVCAKHGIGLVVFSPLSQGVLTGKYNEGVPDDSRAKNVDPNWFSRQLESGRIDQARKVSELASELGVTPSALALAWAMKHPGVSSVITGATKPEQVHENLKALEIKISPELDSRIETALNNKPVRKKHN
jgi:voltage-dependent potassium channel beta subunit